MGDAADDAERRAFEEVGDVATCSSCEAPIIWKTTMRGKPMPLDPKPVKDAHLFVDGDTVKDDRTYPAPANAKRYETHFATCPNAAKHRKR